MNLFSFVMERMTEEGLRGKGSELGHIREIGTFGFVGVERNAVRVLDLAKEELGG
jgi:hypothetical protein